MTRDDLIQLVNDEITVSGSLPYSIPQKEMERIIGQAENWFYVNYGPAVETTYYVLPRNLFAMSGISPAVVFWEQSTQTLQIIVLSLLSCSCRRFNQTTWFSGLPSTLIGI